MKFLSVLLCSLVGIAGARVTSLNSSGSGGDIVVSYRFLCSRSEYRELAVTALRSPLGTATPRTNGLLARSGVSGSPL